MTGTIITSGLTAGYTLTNANPVTIGAGVTITNTDNPAVGSQLPTYWTIVNYGTLLASDVNVLSDGVLLAGGGGAVTNSTHGSISGYYAGISIAGSGTVTNQGSIASANTIGSGFNYYTGRFTATTAGIILGGGGVYNAGSGVITSYLDGVAVGSAGSVVNAGVISAPSTRSGYGVVLTAGGSVTNTQTGTINGGSNGVAAFGDVATVINQGFIYAHNDIAVALVDGGYLNNASTGQISGYSDGLLAEGTIATTVENAGLLYGYRYAGAWLNNGTSITNSGTVLIASITNSATGLILGRYFGVAVHGGSGSVLNTGTIAATATLSQANQTSFSSAGVQLVGGGTVTNQAGGVISSAWMGVQIGYPGTNSAGGTVTNQGTIFAADAAGDGAGIWIHGPGAITNASGGVISGGAFGIVAYDQTTLVNQGTIFGTNDAFDAVRSGYADRIIDLPGGVFSGIVSGGNTLGSAIYSTLELASGSSTGTIVNAGTFVDIGVIKIDAGATWSVGGSIVAGETITFGGPDATLILASPAAMGATITGFAATDRIELSGVTDVTGLSFRTGNTLAVAESAGSGLALSFGSEPPVAFSTGDGATDIFVPCFLPGTYIMTDRGEVVIENLHVGDSIATLGGRTRRLCWIGQGRALATRGRRTAATPVIVRKGALADNVPHQDLRITKGHSLYFDGVLIPVEYLINHRSILWDDRAQEVQVFHLELDAHDVLIANGVAAESYRDDDNRWLFQNANAGWDQPPKPPCAPVVTGGDMVDAIWHRLLERAGPRPGLPLTDDPDLHLLVDGERVNAHEVRGTVHVFRLIRLPASVRIASREAVPAELGVARDSRSLGVALREVAVRKGSKFVVLKAEDARLAEGFHAYEPTGGLRWTDGCGTLPAEMFIRFRGAVEVVLNIAGTTRYPSCGGSARAAA